ncbi:Uncharacterised protein [Mycobacteroides abscessus subsp. abscessus]|nr:Uncharacterised protein [Mycobacteroides abscessus subsp. abscessus]SKT90624.1 Uncharacterised protein [Mycobacteroides abscessus subsp. abscessus]
MNLLENRQGLLGNLHPGWVSMIGDLPNLCMRYAEIP